MLHSGTRRLGQFGKFMVFIQNEILHYFMASFRFKLHFLQEACKLDCPFELQKLIDQPGFSKSNSNTKLKWNIKCVCMGMDSVIMLLLRIKKMYISLFGSGV